MDRGTGTPPPGHPYDGCADCVEHTRALLASIQARRITIQAPTAAELERHARRFGPEGVEETAAELGVPVRVERAASRPRRAKGPTLRQRVATHVAEGRGVELIAELENLSPSRARRLVQEATS